MKVEKSLFHTPVKRKQELTENRRDLTGRATKSQRLSTQFEPAQS